MGLQVDYFDNAGVFGTRPFTATYSAHVNVCWLKDICAYKRKFYLTAPRNQQFSEGAFL